MNFYHKNPHLSKLKRDVYPHLGIDTDYCDVVRMFGDVKMVVMGATKRLMQRIANSMLDQLKIKLPHRQSLINIASGSAGRFAMYKAGAIICVSHGIGIPSISIVLHEVIKLIDRASCKNVVFLRLGTCGGLDVEPGTVIISTSCVDSHFDPYYKLDILGKTIQRPAVFDSDLVEDLRFIGSNFLTFETQVGMTLCTNDFYEEQGRIDGASCDFTEKDRKRFLENACEKEVVNIEMESLGFGALCYHLNIKAAVICVTVVNRLKDDQVNASKEQLAEWEDRPTLIAVEYFRQKFDEYQTDGYHNNKQGGVVKVSSY